jgi:hypothetical protein
MSQASPNQRISAAGYRNQGGRAFLLQDWITVRGNSSSVAGVTQSQELWLEIPQFADAVFWIDVSEVTNPSSGLVLLNLESSPTCDESLFQPVAGIVGMTPATTPTVIKSVAGAGSTAPLSRYVRWRISTTGTGSAWSATFRIRLVGNRSSYWVPTQLSGALLWVRADLGLTISNTGVTGWADQSSNGKNLSSGATPPTWVASSAIRAANPALRFTGSQLMATGSSLWTGAQARTLIVVYKPSSLPGNMEVAGQTGTGATAQWFQLITVPGAGDPYFAGWNDDIAGPTADTNAKWAMVTHSGSSGTAILYKNGASVGSLSFTPNTNNEPFRVGVGWNGAAFQEYFNGDVGEIISYDHVLSTSERTLIQSYIRAYWGI